LQPGDYLRPGYFTVTDAVRILQKKPAVVDQYEIAKYINARRTNKLDNKSAYRYLNDIGKHLLKFLTEASAGIPLPPFLQHPDSISVITFCQASGIIDLLKHFHDNPQPAREISEK
jgi:hypothetical protein